jgi:hypothetical protein
VGNKLLNRKDVPFSREDAYRLIEKHKNFPPSDRITRIRADLAAMGFAEVDVQTPEGPRPVIDVIVDDLGSYSNF